LSRQEDLHQASQRLCRSLKFDTHMFLLNSKKNASIAVFSFGSVRGIAKMMLVLLNGEDRQSMLFRVARVQLVFAEMVGFDFP
jgi:hypothetical protein